MDVDAHKRVLVYEVTQSGDCEGRSTKTVAYFLRKADADAVALSEIGNESMGPNRGHVRTIPIWVDLASFVMALGQPPGYTGALDNKAAQLLHKAAGLDWDEESIARASALRKLSPAERKLLGLEDPWNT